MKFELSQDQRDFAAALEGLLTSADAPATARAWAASDHEPGLALWRKLAETGVSGLLADGYRVEHVLAMEAIGHHAAPGPWVESAAYLALCPESAAAVAEGAVATVAVPPHTPYALDADVADLILGGEVGEQVTSIDPVRRLFRVADAPPVQEAAFDAAVLAASAQLLGAGERMLADTVTYAQQRTQFGRQIGSYQAIKHALADVRIALDFVRPLVYAAALGASPVSAAKVAAGDAAYLASRTALQVHGAIGYTREHDLSLWLLRVRGLRSTWGTEAWHRTRLLELVSSR
jgi:alkylation response protein AidB-like acyl-CoA dehydrogenase